MSKHNNDRLACFVCDFWWLFLVFLGLLLGAFLTRQLWLPKELNNISDSDLGTGDIQVTLRWEGGNDLDLHVVDPMGEDIYFDHPVSASQGMLDVDSNAGCVGNLSNHPVENIFWPINKAPKGNYKVYVNYFRYCSEEPADTTYFIRLLVDGHEKEYTGTVSEENQTDLVIEFER